MRVRLLILAAALVLAGCAADPLPEDSYYRLSAQPAVRTQSTPLLAGFLQVDSLRAPGILNERQVLYSRRDANAQLEQYNYHVWIDPPPKLVRQFLIDGLRRANVAKLTADRLPVGPDRFRLSGRLHRFERVARGDRWFAVVAVELRLDSPTAEAVPLVLNKYEKEVEASGSSVAASAQAFSQALNEVVVDLVSELELMDR